MINRYTRPEMGAIWELQNKFSIWKEIEVLALDSGAPRVFLSGKTAQEAGKMGICRIHVSISWDRGNYFAAAISEGEEK